MKKGTIAIIQEMLQFFNLITTSRLNFLGKEHSFHLFFESTLVEKIPTPYLQKKMNTN